MHALILAAVLTAGTYVPSPQQQPAPKANFTEQDRNEAKEALQVVGQAFGISQSKPGDDKKETPKKTMADVADKAIDMTAKFVSVVAGKVEEVAPTVMRIMVRQQYAKAIGNIIAPLIWIILLPVIAVVVRHFWQLRRTPDRIMVKGEEKTILPHDCNVDRCTSCSSADERGFRVGLTLVLPGALTVIAMGIFASSLAESAQLLINPEYFAIKDLLQMLLGAGR